MSNNSPRGYVEETSYRDRMIQEYEEENNWENQFDRIAYRLFGDYFDEKEELTDEFNSKLRAAQFGVDADLYLSRVLLSGILMSILGLLLGGLLAVTGLVLGIFQTLVGGSMLIGSLVAVFVVFVVTMVFGVGAGMGMYIYPSYKANRRKTAIDTALPSAVTFMYALNRGGMSLVEVIKVLAESEDTYGEVSREMQTIVNEIDMRSIDLMEALRRAGHRTPSNKFSDFMDDTLATLDSGGRTDGFLSDKADSMLDEAEREQANFIETLSLMGEVYVTAFVAGPLFLIIITVVMSMLGGSDPSRLDGIVYGLLPFMNVAFFFLIDFIAGADEKVADEISKSSRVKSDTRDVEKFIEETDDERVQNVYEAKQKRERTALLRQPVTELLHNPDLTLLFTAPIALTQVVIVLGLGLATPSVASFIEAPVLQTVLLLLGPIFIMAVPLMIFHEVSTRRQSKMMKKLPDALKQLASANSIGMTLTESLQTTAENTSGRLGVELERVRNDIQWNHDVNAALIKFANRVQVPILTRTVKLITEANESTGDIEEVLEVAAKNVESKYRLKKERNQEMMMYTAVILISFGVYIFVIFLLDKQFLTKIASIGGDASGGGGGGGFELSDLPINRFRMVFYHSTIVQSFGSGMLAGYLKTNDVRSGLKFAIILSTISTAIFTFL